MLNLGSVGFSLNANTTSLGAAGARLQNFGGILANTTTRVRTYGTTLRGVASTQTNFQRSTRRTTGLFRELSAASVLAVGPLSGIGARITAIGGIMDRSSLAFAGFIGGATAAGAAIFKLGQGAVTTASQLDKIRARFEVLAGSPVAATAEFERLRDLSNAAGTELIKTSEGFTKIAAAAQGTSLEGEKINQIFEDIVFSAGKFRLSGEQVTGTLRAIEQIISKGTVQSEELRGQLGERLPGAFRIAAKSMGVTTAELGDLLKEGKVFSEQFLPGFARELRKSLGADGVTQVDGFAASFARLQNAATLFNEKFDRTFNVSQSYIRVVQAVTTGITLFANNLDQLGTAVGAVSGALLVLAAPRILSGIVALATATGTFTKAMLGLNAAVFANPIGGLVSILLRLTAVIGGAVLGMNLMSTAMANSQSASQTAIGAVDAYINSQSALRTSLTQTTSRFATEVQKQITILQEQIKAVDSVLSAQGELRDSNAFDNFFAGLNFKVRSFLKDKGIDNFLGFDALPDKIGDARKAVVSLNAELDKNKERLASLAEIGKKQSDLATKFKPPATEDKGAKRRARALDRAGDTIARLQSQIDSFNSDEVFTGKIGGAIRNVNDLRSAFRDLDSIERFRDQLENAGIAAGKVSMKVAEYSERLSTLRIKQREFAATVERSVEVNRTFADGLVRGILSLGKGETTMESFVRSLTESILEIIVLRPLIDALATSLNNLSGGVGTQGGLGFFGALFGGGGSPLNILPNAKGGAFNQGVKFMAKGGILNGPTLFNTASGPAVGGEAGTEGVLPLARTTRGELGVKAVGGRNSGSGVIALQPLIQIINQTGNSMSAEANRRTGAGGQPIYEVLLKTTQQMAGSGDLTPALQQSQTAGRN